MDIDARINWMPGMELTAQTFKELYQNLDFRQQAAVRAAMGGTRMGLLPGAVFNSQGMFVKNTYEMERFQCMAVLPSGTLLSADEKVSLPIPMLFGDRYYLTVGLSGEERVFEKEGVPFVSARKTYAIQTLEEMQQADVFPVARFRASEGVFSLDADYIPPCLLMESDARFGQYGNTFLEKIQALAEHPNLAEGEGKRCLLHYLFLLKGKNWDGGVQEFVALTQEIAQAVQYYIVTPNTETPVEVPQPSRLDVQLWLGWLADYLGGAATILDGVVLPDNVIDYEALLAQAKAELYERLNPELREALLLQIKEELRAELHTQLSDTLLTFINDDIRPRLHDTLAGELDPSLHERLFQELYDQLYNALYVPPEEDPDFYPLM